MPARSCLGPPPRVATCPGRRPGVVRCFLLVLLAALAACASPASSGGPYQPGAGGLPNFGVDAGAKSDTGLAKDATATADAQADAAIDGTVDVTADATAATDAGADDAAADGGDLDATDGGDDADAGQTDVKPVTVCGDATCNGTEDCKSCPDDCGGCPPTCGDGQCNGAETCTTCPGDCQACGPACGDGTCDTAKENCQSCAADCGKCPDFCGDGKCSDPLESCSTCPGDCGACGAVCGDKKCQGDENCQACPADCGTCPGVKCNLMTSQGCTAAQQCYLGQSGPVCDAAGPSAKGTPCQFWTECQKGLICIEGLCRPICDAVGQTSGFLCAAPGTCIELKDSASKPVGDNLGVCIGNDSCSLLTSAGCPSGQACNWFNGGKVCDPAGNGGDNAPCPNGTECATTHICLKEDGKFVCKQRCHVGGGTPKCKSGACGGLSVGDPPKPAPDSVGACF